MPRKQVGLLVTMVCAAGLASGAAFVWTAGAAPLRSTFVSRLDDRATNFLVAASPDLGDVIELSPVLIVSDLVRWPESRPRDATFGGGDAPRVLE